MATTARVQPKREAHSNVRIPRNHMETLTGPMVKRILDCARDVVADGTHEEISSVVARRTGYSETTIDHAICQALFANEAALRTLTLGISDCLVESRRTYWSVATETAA